MSSEYSSTAPTAAEVRAKPGMTLIEFGTDWCGHCQAAQPLLAKVMPDYPEVTHLKIEDGSGRPLGRAFNVKLWPTLVFLRDGVEVTRLIRPTSVSPLEEALEQLVGEG
ncbi:MULTISPECIES: thioredoxin family protein [Pseudomonas]|uniref:Thioredoxin n=2 Tax=Pseudomonadaceae TaxID=135621 RepID=A0A0D0L0E6_9PSED|nr:MULTISPECIES: thioredoxin family protein [Pseudomonas]KIQ04282.1 thioredoxin [Pseudomonas fulva]MCW2293447.1 thioredoxin 1 [Pseudomonas sp. BIGb0408]NYH71982.1 thioredoxin 1 [Pseudomonas flavescens]